MESAQWLCGGSLISYKHILTAAHCTSDPKVGEVKYVALGILKRSDPPDQWQRYKVSKIILHPQYRAPSKYHDIALLETEKSINFNQHVVPACLHYETHPDDWKAEATGWGALGHRQGLADTLQTVELQQSNQSDCAEQYPPHRLLRNGFDPNTQLCYGDPDKPRDTCEGDSGGPLQNKNHLSSWCVYTVIGVTSYGRSCGFAGSNGVYTRVQHYLSWIESIVWP